MSAQVSIDSNADMSGSPNPGASVAGVDVMARVRPFYWSLRRELWENRSIYIAPMAVAAIVLLSALASLLRLPDGAVPFDRLTEIAPNYLRIAGLSLYGVIASILAITAGIVGWFYCLDALSGERRDRSILFWRSLPVSDVTTVLSKVLVGMAIVPLVSLIVGLALFLVLLVISSVVLMVNDVSGALVLANSALGEALLAHLYIATAAILWAAPIYAWAIFVSSWARRATFLWALMPPAAIALAEGITFGTRHFLGLINARLSDGLRFAFVDPATSVDGQHFKFDSERLPDSLFSIMDPARFLSQPGLWIGLGVAAAFIAAAIWMRRYREPL